MAEKAIRERQLPPGKGHGGREGKAGFKSAIFSRNLVSMYLVPSVKPQRGRLVDIGEKECPPSP